MTIFFSNKFCCGDHWKCFVRCPGLPQSGKKFWKVKKFPGQGKVRELHFQSWEFEINEKSHGKVREFQNFPKKDAS